jgi:far upstream element-binding protein
MVPDRTVGLIIGRGGETIRDLQERSACHVNIVGENKSTNGLRPVNLIGTLESTEKAKELIMEIVDSDTKSQGLERAAREQQHRHGNQHQSRYPSDGYGDSEKNTEHIFVPSEAVGMIIGKGGETIREMQNSSACKINVSQASGADVERDIELVGTKEAIEKAKESIWEKVDAVKDKSGGYGGGRRGGPPRDNRDNYNDRYSQGQQQYSAYGGQQQQQQQPQQGATDPAVDPYAAWGGYQNYVAMWYAALAQNNQGQAQGAPGEQPKPPGA